MLGNTTIELTSHVLADAFRGVLSDGANFRAAVRVTNEWLMQWDLLRLTELKTGYWEIADRGGLIKLCPTFAQALQVALDEAAQRLARSIHAEDLR